MLPNTSPEMRFPPVAWIGPRESQRRSLTLRTESGNTRAKRVPLAVESGRPSTDLTQGNPSRWPFTQRDLAPATSH
jgi:hypothetical protein